MKISRFNADACNFPQPRVPILPNRLELAPRAEWHERIARCRAKGQFRSFALGRYALAEAFRLTGVNRDASVMIPSYQCLTAIDPAIHLGAEVLFYPLRPDLSPDLDKLDTVARNAAKPVKALLATHFFGFPQNLDDLRLWCDKQGIALIEDCAHVLFTEDYQATGTGIFGRFIASSPYKFIACQDGGLLYAPGDRLLRRTKATRSPGPLAELRGFKHLTERLRGSNTISETPEAIAARLAQIARRAAPASELQTDPYAQASPFFSSARTRRAALRGSRLATRLSLIDPVIRGRRRNYRRWVEAVAKLPNCRALYPELPPDGVPYMFPLYIAHPDPHFHWLKHLGVPIWRWDDLAVSSCLVARDYRLHLLHLPCHQSLSDEQMGWMIEAVSQVMRRSPGAVR